MIDLHIHTNASSDGVHTPQQIFQEASRIGIRALAFADHNSTANIDEGISLSDRYRIPFLPAVEINTHHRGHDVHILGYCIDHRSRALKEFFDSFFREAERQTVERVRLLQELGFAIDPKDVTAESGQSLPTGRSFLSALIARKENADNPRLARYVTGDKSRSPSLNFYLDYLAGGRPAFVPLSAVPTITAIEAITASGGVTILAHPGIYPRQIVDQVIDMGIMGLEAYSGHHDEASSHRFMDLCRSRGLIWSAGSDFHGVEVKPDIRLGVTLDDEQTVIDMIRKAYTKKDA